jgi:hypothetical protein
VFFVVNVGPDILYIPLKRYKHKGKTAVSPVREVEREGVALFLAKISEEIIGRVQPARRFKPHLRPILKITANH